MRWNKKEASAHDMIADAVAVWNGGAHALGYERMSKALDLADHGSQAFHEAESLLRLFHRTIEEELEQLDRKVLEFRRILIGQRGAQ